MADADRYDPENWDTYVYTDERSFSFMVCFPTCEIDQVARPVVEKIVEMHVASSFLFRPPINANLDVLN